MTIKSPQLKITLTLWVQNGPFPGSSLIGGGERQKGSPPKISHTYPTMMNLTTVILYLNKIQKKEKSCDTPFSSAESVFFSPKTAIFVISRSTGIDCILIHNF